jgi:hypothetical protein
MKRTTAWAVVGKRERDGVKLVSHYLLIFWLKKIAIEEAEKYNGRVIKVAVEEIYG